MYTGGKALHSAKYLRRKRNKIFLTGFLSVFVIAVVVFILSQISHLDFLTIKNIEISDLKTLNKDELHSFIEQSLDGDYAYLFSKGNIIYFSKDDLKDSLLNKFNNISSLDISRDGLSTIKIDIVEQKSFALYCVGRPEDIEQKGQTESSDDNTSECFYMNEKGYIWSEAPQFSENVFFKYYSTATSTKNPSGQGLSVGDNYSTEEELKAINSLAVNISKNIISIVGIINNQNGQYNLFFENKNGLPRLGTIMFGDINSFDKAYENLELFFKQNKFGKDKSRPAIEYIDLRYGNNIFYKISK